MRMIIIIFGLIIIQPAEAIAQYEVPTNLGDPATQLVEMLAVYDEACLRDFPDDAAVLRMMAARNATALSRDELHGYLRDDPGTGWRVNGATAQFVVTIEAPPYHACGVRTITAAGFPDLQPYRDLISRFESNRAFIPLEPMDRVLSNHVHTRGEAEQLQLADGSFETLMLVTATPAEGHRENGQTGVEVRFVRQIYH